VYWVESQRFCIHTRLAPLPLSVVSSDDMAGPSFLGLRVLILESRREKEMASLVTSYGGQPVNAPSMREIPLESNTEALEFADRLERGEFDLVILLTGVGTKALLEVVEKVRGSRDRFVAALSRTKVVARGPKPLAVLRELQVSAWATVPEPNTWREVLATLDSKSNELPLQDARVAVQEYGASNPDLLDGLRARGASVTAVPVYQWALPEDLGPLSNGVRAIVAGDIDVVMFTTATQVNHLLQVADSMQQGDAVRVQLGRTVIASIGPTTSAELRERGIGIDLEPSHPKMGFLVRETAERAAEIVKTKRA
jgi:uroporphyrinogen-III synthase